MKIVLVDDDPAVRDLVSLQLELEGHEVAPASGGASGLALVRQQRPDLVVPHVMMPELSGWEVLELLREDPGDPQVPVVLLTARNMPHDRQRAYEIGASAGLSSRMTGQCLSRPCTPCHHPRRPTSQLSLHQRGLERPVAMRCAQLLRVRLPDADGRVGSYAYGSFAST